VAQLTLEELDAGIFVVVNLLNAGFGGDCDNTESKSRKVSKRRIMLAELNLKAARKAIKLSAFESAQKYAVMGIKMLPTDRWTKHYLLSLELYSTAAETEGYLGIVDKMKLHCNEVLEQKRGKVQDKLRVHNVLMDSLYIREDLQAATTHCLDVLKMLGCEFPKSNLTRRILTLWGAFRIKLTMKSRTAAEVSSLPLLQEPERIAIMRLLDKLVTYCYVTGNNLLPLVVFRNLRWSLNYGLCLSSPPSFALAGAILAGRLHDYKGGRRYGENGLVSLQNLNRKFGDQSRAIESRTIFIIYSFVLPWTSPLHGMVKPLFRGYEVGMQMGDTDSAFWAICHYLLIGLHSGRPLHALEADCVTYVQQGKELKREQQVGYITLLWQTVLNLRHQVDNPTILTGEVMDQDKCMSAATSIGSPVMMGWIEALQSQLCTFFGDHEVGAYLAIEKGGRGTYVMAGSPHVAVDPFYGAISLFSMARTTKQDNFKVRAKQLAATIKSCVARGNPNLRQLDLILDAELAALAGKELVARKNYQDAIVMSARCGFIQHAALANERYGEYMFHVVKDNDEAEYRFEQAFKYYLDWGAGAKAEMLQTKYQRLIPGPAAAATATTI
jgi:predicted ATPase